MRSDELSALRLDECSRQNLLVITMLLCRRSLVGDKALREFRLEDTCSEKNIVRKTCATEFYTYFRMQMAKISGSFVIEMPVTKQTATV